VSAQADLDSLAQEDFPMSHDTHQGPVSLHRALAVALAGLLAAGCSERGPVGPQPGTARPNFVAVDRTFTFTPIHVPGALATVPQGINAGDDVVGYFVDPAGGSHGFLLRRGELTTIDFPGAEGTDARGISPGGEIVGAYWMPGEPAVNAHGYLLTRQGEFVRVDYPGHTNNIPQRILPDGTILGCRHDNDFSTTMRGVVIGRDGFNEIGAFSSMHNGATPDLRRIVGWYVNLEVGTGRQEGYTIDDGVFSPLVVPGSMATSAWDVNPAGDVVGIYRNAAGFHGFIWTDEGIVTLDVPGATATRAYGINAGGDVVGSYVAGGKTHGYLASATWRHRL
jgi:uncharacterized membrane protein